MRKTCNYRPVTNLQDKNKIKSVSSVCADAKEMCKILGDNSNIKV